MTRPKPGEIKLSLEAAMLERLDKLVPMVAESAAAREFGIEVDRRLVARVALLRGLTAMEAAVPSGSAPDMPRSPAVEVAPPPPLVIPLPDDVSLGSSTADSVSAGAGKAELGEDGSYDLPEGWHMWSSGERVPSEHQEIHDHYVSGGWGRYWGRVGEEVIAFYWTPDPALQDYPSYKKADRNGKALNVQKTPYGPGHIIPHGWSA